MSCAAQESAELYEFVVMGMTTQLRLHLKETLNWRVATQPEFFQGRTSSFCGIVNDSNGDKGLRFGVNSSHIDRLP